LTGTFKMRSSTGLPNVYNWQVKAKMAPFNHTEEMLEKGREGIVFNIQRFSLQDGPGIRTTVFLKGCPLKCAWCSNPESQDPLPEILYRSQKCQKCRTCEDVCKRGAIRFTDDAPFLDRALCDLCEDCVNSCIGGALEITGKRMTVEEVVDEAYRDEAFYNNSGGGVTLSGGEPLFQPDFTLKLLRKCRELGLRTCLDTCGFAPWDTIDRLRAYTDLFLFDLKHTDPGLHLEWTGAGNDRIMDNLKRLTATGRNRVWVRIPVIKGFNDSDAFFRDVAATLNGKMIEKVSLLGYHEWGKSKYTALGREYLLEGVGPCKEGSLETYKHFLEDQGFQVNIDH
jgi:pyruvate formate lyase activating enzyme